MNTFYSDKEIKGLGLKKYGKNVLISRNALLYAPQFLEIGDNVRIDDFAIISGKVILKNYIHIAQFCGLYGGDEGIVMEDYSGLSSRVTIYATSNDYSGDSMTNPMVPDKYKPHNHNEAVVVGKHAIVGSGSVVLPGVNVGEGCAVGAITLCNKNMKPWGIYGGVPAKRLKERSRKLLELEAELVAETER